MYSCSSCDQERGEEDFSESQLKRAKKNNKATCKQCIRAKYILKTYGITLDDYDDMLREQSGCCKICYKKFKQGVNAHVDHDHDTGEVRGLLCLNCNTGIGKLQDTAEICLSAALYLLTTGESKPDDLQLQQKIATLGSWLDADPAKKDIQAVPVALPLLKNASQSSIPKTSPEISKTEANTSNNSTTPKKIDIAATTASKKTDCGCRNSQCENNRCTCRKSTTKCTKQCHDGSPCNNN